MADLKEVTKQLNKAKIQLLAGNKVFITSILFDLKQKLDETINPPTAATDGASLYLHPDFVEKQDPEELKGLLAHEVYHVAFNHMFRGRDYDPRKYNMAADYVINQYLVDDGFTLPKGGLLDAKYKGMAVLEVYDLLPDPPEEDTPGSGIGGDIIYDDPNGNSSKAKDKKTAIDNMLIKAVTAAKMEGNKTAGSIPGDLEVYLDKLLNPKLPWNIILQRYVNGFAKEESTYRRPNRRFLPLGIVMPTMHSEKLANITVAVDTSGSVSQKEFTAFITEIHKIHTSMTPEELTILDFDTDIKSEQVVKSAHDLKNVSFHGRGGTNIEPVLEWVKEKKPEVTIIFSDGYFHINDSMDPKVPIIWIAVENKSFKPPFGKVIHYEID